MATLASRILGLIDGWMQYWVRRHSRVGGI